MNIISRALRFRRGGALRLLATLALLLIPGLAVAAESAVGHLGETLQIWWAIPFVGILLSIALFPLFAPDWWHHHFPQVSLFWAVLLAAPFLIIHRGEAFHEITHIFLADYFPFIILLWALYSVSSGILLSGTLHGTPKENVLILISGTLLASWIGTTGASMVMIRPLLRAIAWRKQRVHIIVFFIFLVSNIGGALTPLGDPPLFLGFLHHVPFFWTLHLFPPMVFLSVPLLTLFYFIDRRMFARETREAPVGRPERMGIRGKLNFVFLGAIVAAVLMSGVVKLGFVHVLGVELKIESILRDAIIVTVGLVSFKTTSDTIHRANQFSWFPIKEVAILFAGIFMTIIPALAILKAGENGALAGLIGLAHRPSNYFWLTGGLSSFLDNAPTYLTFFNTALGALFPSMPEPLAVAKLIELHGHYLHAISCGAVFMGANTYIGNAPNFMVKSIAEEAGIQMPSFFGYMFKYSIPILMPLFLIMTFLFFV
ncbi:MAG TPA: sodium:proton antiporter [Candidatus Krumholzibacteria bacterium]|nr:sodium:proton antiporter [Candidatus Krumholzibacteria bacterium]